MKVNSQMKRAFVAVLCVVTMLFSSISPLAGNIATTQAAEGSYKELTFSDWGMTNGEYVAGDTYDLVDTSITSLDGVALNGMFEISESAALYFGGVDNGWSKTYALIRQGEASEEIAFAAEDSSVYAGGGNINVDEIREKLNDTSFTLLNNEFELRLTFDIQEDKSFVVGVYINDTFIKGIAYTAGESATLGTKMLVWPVSGSLDLRDVVDGEPVYQELTLKDFGVYPGYMQSVVIGDSDEITSLDEVAVSGKVKFGNDGWLIMGHEDVNSTAWSGIRMHVNEAKDGLDVSSVLMVQNELEQFDVTDSSGSTYSITDEGYIKVDFDGTAGWCDVNFSQVSATKEIHVFLKNDSDYPRYVQMDWKSATKVLKDGVDITDNSENATKIPANSGWVEVIYPFASGTQFNCISRETSDNMSVGSLLIKGYYVDERPAEQSYNFPSSESLISTGVDLANDYVNMRYTFDYTDTGVNMGVYVNDNFIKTITFGDSADGVYNIKECLGKYIMATGGFTYMADVDRIDVSYELTDVSPSYLVTGTATVLKDGEEITLSDDCAISAPGDYEVITDVADKCIRYHQKVVLYKIGDVDLNGTAGEASDLTALEAIYVATSFEANSAAEKAADLDNDGRVDAEDWQLMKQIVAAADSATELKAVKEKYHPAAKSYDYLDNAANEKDVMPIVGYYGPYNNDGIDMLKDEYFQLVKDSGINLVSYSYNNAGGQLSPVIETLKMAEKYQLGWFVYDESLNSAKTGVEFTDKEFAETLGRYAYYDSFLGILIADEPIYEDSAESTLLRNDNLMSNYTAISKRLNKYGNLTGHINLAPEDSYLVNGVFDDYFDEYFEQYVNETKPQVLSVDDYPFNDDADEGVTNAGGYFRSLSKIREQSVDNDIPFWWYVQAGGNFENTSDSGYSYKTDHVATEEETYWNVNTALAFGAKGIQYFTLIQSQGFYDSSQTKQLNGLLDANGNKNEYYDYAVNINAHIANVDEVLMKAESKGVITTSGHAETEVNDGVTENQNNVSSFKSPVITAADTSRLKSVTSSDSTYGALVGCFDYRNTEAYYVVNYNVTAGTSQTVTLELNDEYNYRVIQQGENAYSVIGTTCELTIPAGEAVLVVLDGVAGDANGDGEFDSRDLVRHKRVEAEEARIEFSQGYEPDLNADDIVDESDIEWVRYYLAQGKFGGRETVTLKSSAEGE